MNAKDFDQEIVGTLDRMRKALAEPRPCIVIADNGERVQVLLALMTPQGPVPLCEILPSESQTVPRDAFPAKGHEPHPTIQ